jgi:hypothetical protein
MKIDGYLKYKIKRIDKYSLSGRLRKVKEVNRKCI